MAWLQDSLYVVIPLALILVFVFVRGLTPNVRIRKGLRLSIMLLLAALVLELIHAWYLFTAPIPVSGSVIPTTQGTTEEKLRTSEFLLIVLALINATVSLLFNRFKHEAASDKYPAIVQDTIVIGSFVVIATYWWPEKLLTTSAMGAVIVGFALQDTLGNLFAGLAIQVERPFSVGDWIRSAEHEGLVQEVTWRATKIRTKAGNFIIIPNSLISKDKIVNYSQPSRLLRLEQIVSLGYEVHPNEVKKIVLDTIADIPEFLREPEPDVLLSHYGESSLQYRCRFWIDDFAVTDPMLDKFATLLYYRLSRAGVAIPFPIRDVRLTGRQRAAARLEAVEDSRLRFLERVDLFRELSREDKTLIAGAMQTVTFASSELIIRQGAPGDSMFFIRSGNVSIALESGGETHPIAVLGEGQYFGEMSLLTGESRTASVVAQGDVEAYALRKDEFRDVLLQAPGIATDLSRVMAGRKRVLEEKTAQVAAHALSPKETQESFLRKIQKFFGL